MLSGVSSARTKSRGEARSRSRKCAARRMPDIGCWAPLSSIKTPKVGVVISLYLSRSTAGYFMSRSQSMRAVRAALSTVCV
jgi:hypothetical protein